MSECQTLNRVIFSELQGVNLLRQIQLFFLLKARIITRLTGRLFFQRFTVNFRACDWEFICVVQWVLSYGSHFIGDPTHDLDSVQTSCYRFTTVTSQIWQHAELSVQKTTGEFSFKIMFSESNSLSSGIFTGSNSAQPSRAMSCA